MSDKKSSGKGTESEPWVVDFKEDDPEAEAAPKAEAKKPSPNKGVVYKRLPSGKLVPE
jgi:hypothetical protein